MRFISHFQFWQIYTKGWGFRSWWYKCKTEFIPMYIAWKLPKSVALWAFIRVYAKDGNCPGEEHVS